MPVDVAEPMTKKGTSRRDSRAPEDAFQEGKGGPQYRNPT